MTGAKIEDARRRKQPSHNKDAPRPWDRFFDAPGIDLGKRDQPAPDVRESF